MTSRLARAFISTFDIRHLLFIFPIPMTILINLLLAIYVLIALLMILVILMQRPKSEGLGAAFGAAVTENIFGAQTTNVLVKFTAWLAGILFLITFSLSVLYAHKSTGDTSLRRELMKQQGAAQPSPATTGARPSPASSAAPDSGAGVLPAGSAAPSAPTSNAPNGVVPSNSVPIKPPNAPASSPPKPKRE